MAQIALNYSAAQINAAIAKITTLVSVIEGNIVQLYDGTTAIYPRTKAEAVFFNNDISKTLDVQYKDLEQNIRYYNCSTAAATATKVIPISDASNYTRKTGGSIKIKFTYANTAASGVTLQIGSAVAAPLYYDGAVVTAENSWSDGETVDVYFDGTNYYVNNTSGGKFLTGEKVKNVGIDATPTTDSHNLVESGGVKAELSQLKQEQTQQFNQLKQEQTQQFNQLKQEQIQGGNYDVSVHNNNAVFESLQALLSSSDLDSLIPISVRCGGMNIRFINSLDNKYVQYRYTGIETIGNPNPFLDNANWKCTDSTIIFENTEEKEFILPNILNKCGTIRSLTIHSFQGAQEGCVNEYMLEFTVSGDDFTLTLPEGVRWTEDPTWENGYTYQVSIVNNLAVYAGWEAQTDE